MSRQEILVNVYTQLRNAGFVYNKGDFAHQLNYDPCHISSAFSGSRTISDKFLARIHQVFPQVNEVYLRTGRGSVLETVGSREYTESLSLGLFRDSYLIESLLAERDSIQRSLDRVNHLIDMLSRQNMKSAS